MVQFLGVRPHTVATSSKKHFWRLWGNFKNILFSGLIFKEKGPPRLGGPVFDQR
jgi:hypothetical protein